MIRSSAIRLGIPVRHLTLRILIPFGIMLFVVVGILSFFATNRLHERALFEQQVTLKTLFESQASVHSSRNKLVVLAQNRGFERVWVLGATGDILDSSKESDIGTQLDSRWWDRLRDHPSGFVHDTVDFGSQSLSMTALHHAEMGRWVVIVSKPQSMWPLIWLYSGLILIVGFLIWLLTAALIWGTINRQVASPIKKLDDRAVELIRGSTLTEATLDRLVAETSPALGGHADCVVDLVRKVRESQEKIIESTSRIQQIFDGIPSPAFIRTPEGKIRQANKALAKRLAVDPSWVEGQTLNMLKGVVPVIHLEKWFSKDSAAKVGIERLELFPSAETDLDVPILLTIQPIRLEGSICHLVIVENRVETEDVSPTKRAWTDDNAIASSVSSGDGAVLDAEITETTRPDRLLEGLMAATGQFVVAFNEETNTIFWSPSARAITGLSLTDIPDMRSFADRVFSSKQEKKLFKTWIDGVPDERSQELKVKTAEGTVTSRWHASEIELENNGSAGVLWAHLDTPITRKVKSKREPAAK